MDCEIAVPIKNNNHGSDYIVVVSERYIDRHATDSSTLHMQTHYVAAGGPE